MSIEQLLADLAVAVRENTAQLAFLTAKAREVSGTKSVTVDTSAKKPEEVEPTPEKAVKKVEEVEPAPEKAVRKREVKEKAKVITDNEWRKLLADFVDVKDDDEYAARRDFVMKVAAKYDLRKMSEIPADKRREALDLLTAYKNGEETGLEDDERDDDL